MASRPVWLQAEAVPGGLGVALSSGGCALRRVRPRGGGTGRAACGWRQQPSQAWIGGQWYGPAGPRPTAGDEEGPGLRAAEEAERGRRSSPGAAGARWGSALKGSYVLRPLDEKEELNLVVAV
ncbi:hypothetical protein NDU88_005625 [Pleurodeles waltl]|uniref:Uncharacterized protein n=1 Tax=Pleurodeles waltl TaxID=8319 RepID=A0AAV7N0R5_PLEWA|nr:hypothetical protein NDU88_005625 [Pleurodeles waltl]